MFADLGPFIVYPIYLQINFFLPKTTYSSLILVLAILLLINWVKLIFTNNDSTKQINQYIKKQNMTIHFFILIMFIKYELLSVFCFSMY